MTDFEQYWSNDISIRTFIRDRDEYHELSQYDGRPQKQWGEIQGAIFVDIDGQSLMGKDSWDHISAVWLTFLEAFDELRASKSVDGALWVPNHSVYLDKKGDSLVKIEIGCGRGNQAHAIVNKKQLIEAVIQSANLFLLEYQRFESFPVQEYEEIICRLKRDFLEAYSPA